MDIFTISGRNYDSNVYVIIGNTPTVIDTGTGLYNKEIMEAIKKFTDPATIKQIILTHEHFDHVGGTLDILKATNDNAKVFAHKNAVNKLKKGESSFARLLGCVMPKIQVDTPLSDGENVVLGDEEFEVMYTPGHSLGSMCLYNKGKKVLISGDTIFAHGDFGRYDLPGGNFQSLVQSIQRLSDLDIIHLYPGHGPIVEEYGKNHVLQSYKNIQSMM
ncbi:MAG: MBL fold metallo-hydrolase [Candidatus Thermoplasmatota archaeon]|nr:MBL fold metallo-hydrolase [Candidatus Thermoplasmatota archaeon]